MAAAVREALSEGFGVAASKPFRAVEDFTFVGMGTDPNPPSDIPVSVDHDKWYAEAAASRWEGADEPEEP